METLKDIFNSYKSEIISAKGLTIDIDGIDCYGLYGKIKKISLQDKVIYKGIGGAIFVDKNHDFSYYLEKDNLADNATVRDCGKYTWGDARFIGATSTSIGSGLSNTNILIKANLTRKLDRRFMFWNLIRKFRETHSDNWFLPSKDELNLIYEVRANLNNLILDASKVPFYWSSSEYSFDCVWSQDFGNGLRQRDFKNYITLHSRLCAQY